MYWTALDFHVLCSFTGRFSHCQFYWVLCRIYFCPVWVGHLFQDCVFFLRNFLFASYKWVAIRTGYAAFLIFRLSRNRQTLMPETSPTKESLWKNFAMKVMKVFSETYSTFLCLERTTVSGFRFFVVFPGSFFSNVTLNFLLAQRSVTRKKNLRKKVLSLAVSRKQVWSSFRRFGPGGVCFLPRFFF